MDTYDTCVTVNGHLVFLSGSYGPPSIRYLLDHLEEKGGAPWCGRPPRHVELNGVRVPPEEFGRHLLNEDDELRIRPDEAEEAPPSPTSPPSRDASGARLEAAASSARGEEADAPNAGPPPPRTHYVMASVEVRRERPGQRPWLDRRLVMASGASAEAALAAAHAEARRRWGPDAPFDVLDQASREGNQPLFHHVVGVARFCERNGEAIVEEHLFGAFSSLERLARRAASEMCQRAAWNWDRLSDAGEVASGAVPTRIEPGEKESDSVREAPGA